MIKRIVAWVIAIMFFAGVTPVFAEKGGKGGGPNPSQKAYEHANDNAKFKRSGDVAGEEGEKAEKGGKEKKVREKEQKQKHKEKGKKAKKSK